MAQTRDTEDTSPCSGSAEGGNNQDRCSGLTGVGWPILTEETTLPLTIVQSLIRRPRLMASTSPGTLVGTKLEMRTKPFLRGQDLDPMFEHLDSAGPRRLSFAVTSVSGVYSFATPLTLTKAGAHPRGRAYLCPFISATSVMPPTLKRKYSRFRARAMERAMLVLPTPGGP